MRGVNREGKGVPNEVREGKCTHRQTQVACVTCNGLSSNEQSTFPTPAPLCNTSGMPSNVKFLLRGVKGCGYRSVWLWEAVRRKLSGTRVVGVS